MSRKLQNVQALRAVAALGVVAAHISGNAGAVDGLWRTYASSGGVGGVDLFFVISGFIMVYVTLDHWREPRHFLAARAMRIFPLWWFCIFLFSNTFGGLWNAATGPYAFDWHAIRSLFLVPSLDTQGFLWPTIGVGWTLSYEMFFYLLFSALVAFAPPRWLWLQTAVLFSLCYALGLLLPNTWAVAQFLHNPIYFEFVLGIALGELYVHRRLGWIALGAIAAAVFLFSAALAAVAPGLHANRFVLYGLPATFILAAAIWIEPHLRAPWLLILLGDASYSIYLVHSDLVGWLFAIFPSVPPMPRTLLVFVGAALSGLLVYMSVETPLRLMLRPSCYTLARGFFARSADLALAAIKRPAR